MKERILVWVLALLLGFALPSFAAKYKVEPVSGGGSVKGTVKLKGAQPESEKILITKNKDICGSGYREIQWVPLGPKKGLPEMVVYLNKIAKGKDWSGDLAKPVVIDQKKCAFSPWLQVVQHKAEVTVKNSDPVLHNIHIRELIGIKPGKPRGVKRTMFNEGQPPGSGDLKSKIAPRRSSLIAINCEAHNFMFAWAFAAKTPYVAKTDANGNYEIKDIPPGSYDLMAWHPTLGLQKQKITVKGGAAATSNFTY